MKLCGFCPDQQNPNEANTTLKIASGTEFPVCTDCLSDWNEQLYNDWLAQQDEAMSEPGYNAHPQAMGKMP